MLSAWLYFHWWISTVLRLVPKKWNRLTLSTHVGHLKKKKIHTIKNKKEQRIEVVSIHGSLWKMLNVRVFLTSRPSIYWGLNVALDYIRRKVAIFLANKNLVQVRSAFNVEWNKFSRSLICKNLLDTSCWNNLFNTLFRGERGEGCITMVRVKRL